MIVSRILAAGILAVSTLGAPSPVQQEGPPQIVGRWLVNADLRSCENSICAYDVDFYQNIYGTLTERFEFFVSDQGWNISGRQPSFQVGGGVNVDGKYMVNGTYMIWADWSPRDFVCITVANTIRKFWTRFLIGSFNGRFPDTYSQSSLVFTYEDMEEIPPPPLDMPSVSQNLDDDSADHPDRLRIREEVESDEDDFWQIQGMNRDYRAASHLTYLDFTIVMADGKRENCHLIVPETEPDSSFYAIPCGVSGYTVSWGYKADTDGGVMTICNPALHKNAWFGWDGIGRRSYLGDSPRNVARTVDCE